MPAQSERLHFSERWLNAYERYRYRRHIHAFRLGLAIVFSTLLAKVFHLQHGEWIGMTVFVVLGMLQFQGAIYSKAVERMLGTAIGLGVGLAVLWLNQHYLQDDVFFYLIIGAASAVAGWSAVGKNGYVAMLAGLTMCMLIGDSSHHWLDSGLMRAMNVLIGAAIAIAAAKLLPLRSTLMWRFMLADNLTDCAKMIAEISNGKRMTRERLEQNMIKMRKNQRPHGQKPQPSGRNIRRKPHQQQYDGSHAACPPQNRHHHRAAPDHRRQTARTPRSTKSEIRLLDRHFNQLQRELRLTVRLIKGHYARRIRIDTSLNTELSKPAARLHYDWQGFLWLSTNMRNEIAALVILLQRSRNKWLDKKELQRLKEHLRNDTDPEQQ